MKILELDSALCSTLNMQAIMLRFVNLSFIAIARIMDKHLKTLAARHLETKFIRLDAEVSIFSCLVVCMCLIEYGVALFSHFVDVQLL